MRRRLARCAALATALAFAWPLPIAAQAPAAQPPSAAQPASPAGEPAPASAPAAGVPAPADAASAPAPAGAASAPRLSEEERARRRAAREAPMRAQWQLIINAPDPLRELLMRHLDVARFRSELASETTSLRELTRLVGAAPAQAHRLLETEGYFGAQVNAQLVATGAPRPGEAAEPADTSTEAPAAMPVVRIDVVPGPIATVQRLTIEVQGALQERAAAGDDAARELIEKLNNDWPLKAGRPFRQADWTAAKNGVLTQLRAEAYPLANWVGTGAQVDPQTHQVRIFVVADSGPHFRFGPLRIEGLSRYGESAVSHLAPFHAGAPYSEKGLLDFQERLAKANLFDSVSVSIEPDESNAAAVPVLVRLRELPAQQAMVGIGVSSDTGPRITLEHLHRRVFGWDWQAKTKIELGRKRRVLQSDFTSHAQPGAYRNLVSAGISKEVANEVTIDLQKARVGRTQETDHIERLYYLEWQEAKTSVGGVPSGAGALTGNYEWVWRSLDSNLLPTQGLAASARAGAGRSFIPTGVSGEVAGWFTRATGRLTLYRPIGKWYSQMRIEAGEVFARDNVAIPYTLLFRAGGDNSVRGYAYQSLGPPRGPGGVAVGGRVMATGSVELARPVLERLPAWWGAVFIDAGNAAPSWTSLSLAVGYGVGVRWRSPVGPLSLDLAYGKDARKLRLHFNVGVVF
jgi:translocation and assembly module TamA